MSETLDLKAVNNFKKYLRIRSVQPDCDYTECVKFLQGMAAGLCTKGVPVAVHEVAPGKPVVIITWIGLRPELPSLVLSSHMDVVPVFPEQWSHDPFSADEDDQGNIYARGAQDMKCVGIQYLEAVRRLVLRNTKLKRTIHVCFTPDEELGGEGMRLFVETEAFKDLNAGCVLDEGGPCEEDSFYLFYGERTNHPLTVICEGTPGHGSLPLPNTAGEKIAVVVDEFMKKRAEENGKLLGKSVLATGVITSINLTMLEGGVQKNVVPPVMKVTFDIRLSLDTDVETFDNWVDQVCKKAGDGVHFEVLSERKRTEPTKLDETNVWWTTLKAKFDEMKITVMPAIMPAMTDAQYVRSKGIPAFNFSPMNFTPLRVHAFDEFLNRKVFLRGVDMYCEIISALGNIKQ